MLTKRLSMYWMLHTRISTYLIGSKYLNLPKKIEVLPGVFKWKWLTHALVIYRLDSPEKGVKNNPIVFIGSKEAATPFWENLRKIEGYPSNDIEAGGTLRLVHNEKTIH